MVGLRTAVTLLALAVSLLAALPLHAIWWDTARRSSAELIEALSTQIGSTVRREWWERVVAAESAFSVADQLIRAQPQATATASALSVALSSTLVPSAVVWSDAGGDVTVAARDPEGAIEARVWRSLIPSPAAVTAGDQPAWSDIPSDPVTHAPAVAYAARIGERGVLSTYILMDRFAELLGDIQVGRTGGVYVVEADGAIRVRPVKAGKSPGPRLDAAARAAGAVVAARPRDEVNQVETRRLTADGERYFAGFSPLEFKGRQLVVIVPERDFLEGIEQTTRRLQIGLLVVVLGVAVGAAVVARRVLANPVTALAADLRHVERFDLDRIAYRPSNVREIAQLSSALSRMAAGLADFAKFIPTDLVKSLVASGVRAEPGGDTRELTVFFADVAGFTSMSERIGVGVIDIVSRYLDVMSEAVATNGGTVDKYIGDAVMAFWGAPRLDDRQAERACRCALEGIAALQAAGVVDDRGDPIKVRVGIHGGPAVVGNIGSRRRLNYTAIGDTVNLASRLEGANKVFGTTILISGVTEEAARATIVTRLICAVAVVGRDEPTPLYELIGLSETLSKPQWAIDYEQALADYGARRFEAARAALTVILRTRPDDGPTRWLLAQCERRIAEPPGPEWTGVAVLEGK